MTQRTVLRFMTVAIATVIGVSCSKDKATPDPGVRTRLSAYVEKDGKGIVYVTDLPGDTTAAPGKPGKPVYFSLSSNANVDSLKKLTSDWDIAFTNIYNSYVTINSGANVMSPGYTGAGTGQLFIVDKPFDSVKVVPDVSAINANGSTGMDGYPSASWPGWYQYNPTTHIMTVIQGKTLVIRLAGGKYAKLEMNSLYKGNPASPTLSTPVPYFTFRYWVQQNGSTSLQIP